MNYSGFVRPWLDKFAALEAQLRTVAADLGDVQAELRRVLPALLGAVASEPHWLVKDFHVLYRAAEIALAQAQLDGYGTAHLRDLARQLERLRPALEQCEVERQSAKSSREAGK